MLTLVYTLGDDCALAWKTTTISCRHALSSFGNPSYRAARRERLMRGGERDRTSGPSERTYSSTRPATFARSMMQARRRSVRSSDAASRSSQPGRANPID
jgi:hypothetical protein